MRSLMVLIMLTLMVPCAWAEERVKSADPTVEDQPVAEQAAKEPLAEDSEAVEAIKPDLGVQLRMRMNNDYLAGNVFVVASWRW